MIFNELRNQIHQFAKGDISVEAFADWFAGIFYDIEKSHNKVAIQLCYAIEWILADLSQGALSEMDLKNRLLQLVPHSTSSGKIDLRFFWTSLPSQMQPVIEQHLFKDNQVSSESLSPTLLPDSVRLPLAKPCS